MKRRHLLRSMGLASLLSPLRLASGHAVTAQTATGTKISLPELPNPTPLSEAVLFAFDDRAFPFQNGVQTHLIPGRNPSLVLEHGPEGSHDEVLLYYGTVVRIGDTFHMWYNGNYGPRDNDVNIERKYCAICYATSKDGVRWEKPELGLREFKGSKRNNLVDLDAPGLWSTFAVIHDPDDPDPQRLFKAAYETKINREIRFCVAFSSDGLHWVPSKNNPVGPFLEMAGATKHKGLYYVNGQSFGHHPGFARRLTTFVSADFEHWSPCAALGLDRGPDIIGPSTEDRAHQYEEVHLGAALWNRGNVILGIYGQWHGHPSGDRRLVVMDLGLALTHDLLHFHEPIPSFRFIPAREQPKAPFGVGPALEQGQGMENFGDKTLYWYSLWRGTEGSGVRLVTWARDQLGMLKPFRARDAMAISCPIQVVKGTAKVYVNAGGLSEQSRLRIGLLNEGFVPIPGFSEQDAFVVAENGFRIPVRWKTNGASLPSQGKVRLHVQFEGARPEDCALYAVYVGA